MSTTCAAGHGSVPESCADTLRRLPFTSTSVYAGPDAAQRRRAHALPLHRVLALRKVERGMQLRQRLVDGDRAGLAQLFRRDDVDRRGAGQRRGVLSCRTQHDDCVDHIGFVSARGVALDVLCLCWWQYRHAQQGDERGSRNRRMKSLSVKHCSRWVRAAGIAFPVAHRTASSPVRDGAESIDAPAPPTNPVLLSAGTGKYVIDSSLGRNRHASSGNQASGAGDS